ncbi:efflux RND transporter periplasmic adaptor subunit [Archangium sp.]|uniref:efflux RND transporter periplasmic adaptor subunit n=1 Tax=Archangium sp. TaxID=1872627 RepID=UPI002D364DA8|nr:efflux RND transporter periplasmic adaptor subunit [Archangium sp.]HYO58452.1 efflux RND transporter periplasmic adaptor subunit [Archangium sp.]
MQPAPSIEPSPAGPSQSELFLGVVLASEAVELSAPFEGQLARVGVQPGDRVKVGTVMGSMALEPLRSEELMAQALLEQAEAEQNRAELEANAAAERLQRYLKSPSGALSIDELSEARYQEKTALAQVAAARARIRERRAALAQIRQRLGEAEFRAPFDCVVAMRYLDPGTRVQAGRPVLRLIQAGGFRVRFAIPEGLSGRATTGLPVTIHLPALGKELPGKLESISPEVDGPSRMVFAMATLLSPNDAIRAGMAARVSLGAGLNPQIPPSAGGQLGKNSGD